MQLWLKFAWPWPRGVRDLKMSLWLFIPIAMSASNFAPPIPVKRPVKAIKSDGFTFVSQSIAPKSDSGIRTCVASAGCFRCTGVNRERFGHITTFYEVDVRRRMHFQKPAKRHGYYKQRWTVCGFQMFRIDAWRSDEEVDEI